MTAISNRLGALNRSLRMTRNTVDPSVVLEGLKFVTTNGPIATAAREALTKEPLMKLIEEMAHAMCNERAAQEALTYKLRCIVNAL